MSSTINIKTEYQRGKANEKLELAANDPKQQKLRFFFYQNGTVCDIAVIH